MWLCNVEQNRYVWMEKEMTVKVRGEANGKGGLTNTAGKTTLLASFRLKLLP
jgi:hypothetical protein